MGKRLTDAEFDRLMDKARKTNAQRDQLEREAGFAAPPDIPPFDQVRTAQLAIECGLRTRDNNAIAEGLAMLEEVEKQFLQLARRRVPDGS